MQHPLRTWRHSLPPEQRTLEAVGKRLGVTKLQVWRWEHGHRRIPPEKVPAISAITGIPPELLRPDVYRAVSAAEGARMLQLAS